jgi:alcohol dehydrogenase class IV
MCGVHHGTANALVLPAVMEFNAARKPGVYKRIGTALDGRTPTTGSSSGRCAGC